MTEQRSIISILEEQTKLTLVDMDSIAKYELMLISKVKELEAIESQVDGIKDSEFLFVERKFDLLAKDKNSEEYKELSNAEKRAIKVKDNLHQNKNYTELVQKCSKLKTEAQVMKVAVESLKRQHEREVKGLRI
jgi:hypothetical protein